MHYSIFYQIYKSLKQYRPRYGFELSAIEYVKKEKYKFKSIEIKFNDFRVAKEVLKRLVHTELSDTEFEGVFVKSFPADLVATMYATEDKPIIIQFSTTTHSMILSGHYELKSKYGIVM